MGGTPIYLITQSKNAISAMELKRQLGVSYPSAWAIKHKLLSVMLWREQASRLDGQVQIDDAYLGGERAGHTFGGRSTVQKSAFVAAVQTDAAGRPQRMRLDPVAGFTKEAIKAWAGKRWPAARMCSAMARPALPRSRSRAPRMRLM